MRKLGNGHEGQTWGCLHNDHLHIILFYGHSDPSPEGECHHTSALTLFSGILATSWLSCCTSTHWIRAQLNSPNLRHFSPAPGQAGPPTVALSSDPAAPLPQATSTSPSPEDPQKSAQAEDYPSYPLSFLSRTQSSLPSCIKSILFKFLISQSFFLSCQTCPHSPCSARSQSRMTIY